MFTWLTKATKTQTLQEENSAGKAKELRSQANVNSV
jgi:hypothetical protein